MPGMTGMATGIRAITITGIMPIMRRMRTIMGRIGTIITQGMLSRLDTTTATSYDDLQDSREAKPTRIQSRHGGWRWRPAYGIGL